MKRYRYRTPTLVGPWRDSRLKAECDAVAAAQADFDESGRQIVWRVAGEIEVREGLGNGSAD
jgi:hypothetical protein